MDDQQCGAAIGIGIEGKAQGFFGERNSHVNHLFRVLASSLRPGGKQGWILVQGALLPTGLVQHTNGSTRVDAVDVRQLVGVEKRDPLLKVWHVGDGDTIWPEVRPLSE